MTVTITSNLILIDDANQTTGWSGFAGINTDTLNNREGGTHLQAQASEESYEVFHTFTSEDYQARTIFGWQLSGAPSAEADPAGLAMTFGDALRDVATAVILAAGTGYTALDVLTVAGGTLAVGKAAATIRVDTVDGGGGILTSTLLTGGGYAADAGTPNSVTGGTGSAATFTLTFAAIPNRVAYAVGGSDNFGFTFLGWSNFRLNTAALPSNFRTITGDEAEMSPDIAVDAGYGGNFPGKAAGNADNVKFDVIRYCPNATRALDVAGGTTGARGTFQEVVTDDENTNNAWGILRLMITGSKAYQCNFGIEIGDPGTADSFFDDSDFQLFINGSIADAGASIAAGSMDFDFVGNSSTSTNLINFDNFFIQSIGAVSNWDATDVNIDELKWTNGQFVDMGSFVFQAQDVGQKFLADIIFVNCGQISPDSMDMDRITINGSSDATGAMLLNEDQDGTSALTDLTFTSDGSGYGIRMRPTGAGPFVFNFDNFQNSGYGADDTADAFIDVDPVTTGANITINLQNGSGTVTVDDTGHAGTLTINNAQTVTVGGVTEGAAVKVVANETVGSITTGDIIFELLADINGETELTTFNYEAAFDPSGLDVIVRARQQGLPNFGISEDNTVFVDQTAAANSATVDDMFLLVDTAPVAGQDWFYFGHAEQFNRMKLDISTVMAGGAALDFEYWNGAWVNLAGVVDGTSAYTNTGVGMITWTLPGDWATTSVDGHGPVFWVRIGYLSGTVSTAPRGRKCKLDVTRYLPFTQNNIIISTGLSVIASWAEDTISKFDDAD